jgi:hypothetical protein
MGGRRSGWRRRWGAGNADEAEGLDVLEEQSGDPGEQTVPDPEPDAGMSTVEYAVGTVAAAAFAAVLYKIVTGDSVITGLTQLVNSAMQAL